jgi:hypothetical protein
MQIGQAGYRPPRRYPNSGALQKALLVPAILGNRQRFEAGSKLVPEHAKRLNRQIFKFIGDYVALLAEPPQRFLIVKSSAGEISRYLGRARLLVRIEYMAFVTNPGCGKSHHPAKLAASQNADGGTGRQGH